MMKHFSEADTSASSSRGFGACRQWCFQALSCWFLHVSRAIFQLRCSPHHVPVAWCSAIFSEGCFYRTLMGSAMSLYVYHEVFTGHAVWWSLLYILVPQWLLGIAILDRVRSYRMNLGSFAKGSTFVVVYYWCFAVSRFEQLPQLPGFVQVISLSTSSRSRAASGIRRFRNTLGFSKEPHAPWGFTKDIFSRTLIFLVPFRSSCLVWVQQFLSCVVYIIKLSRRFQCSSVSAVALVLP